MPNAIGNPASTTILPAWIVLPIAVLTLLVVATHVLAVHQSELPLHRRRIRVVNGLLMLVVTALMAYALGMATVVESPSTNPAAAREFLIVWLSIIGLVGIVIALAGADAVHTVLGGFRVRRQLRREMRNNLAQDLAKRHAPSGAPAVRAAPAQDTRRGA